MRFPPQRRVVMRYVIYPRCRRKFSGELPHFRERSLLSKQRYGMNSVSIRADPLMKILKVFRFGEEKKGFDPLVQKSSQPHFQSLFRNDPYHASSICHAPCIKR